MTSLLRLLPTIFSILSTLIAWWERAKVKAETRKEVAAEIATQNAEIANEAASIVAEHRPDNDAADRLSDGRF